MACVFKVIMLQTVAARRLQHRRDRERDSKINITLQSTPIKTSCYTEILKANMNDDKIALIVYFKLMRLAMAGKNYGKFCRTCPIGGGAAE